MNNKFSSATKLFFLAVFYVFSFDGYAQSDTNSQPNVILIMADDMGYECLGTYGSTSYQTPVLDSLAANGLQFAHCISQPLCTPSRVKIMTGLYNYRNYEYFGYLNENQFTFGKLMKEAGYQTCIAGKWQLNGLAYKDEITSWNDDSRPQQLSFDEYCLWQLTKGRSEGERFANPLIEQNGEVLERNEDDYGPDIFANYILDFIERKKDQPFFVYYPMVLVHEPFVPTPDSEEWADPSRRYEKDTAYFKDMVAYTDKIVGRIANKLRELNLDENTLLIFTGDNGTHPSITSYTKQRTVQGAKGNTIETGTRVPLVAYWPQMLDGREPHTELIEFSDFFPTLADIVGKQVKSDGQSFYPLLTDADYQSRETAFVHYDPQWSKGVNQYRNQFVQTVDYKLYQNGKLFNIANDPLEKNSLDEASLTKNEREVYSHLVQEMKKHPNWKSEE